MNPVAVERFAAVVCEFVERKPPELNGPPRYPSKRELEAGYLFIVDGLTVREIGELVALSPKTVESHLARFRQKCGLSGTAGRHGSWLPLNAAYWRAVGREDAIHLLEVPL